MNDGWSTDYYDLPEGATQMQDLIEHRGMNFAMGNIFKACYRYGEKEGTSQLYDLNKIIWYANREIRRIEREIEQEFESWEPENSPQSITRNTMPPRRQRSSEPPETKQDERPRQLDLFEKETERKSTTRRL